MSEARMVATDFGPVALPAGNKLTESGIKKLAERRYKRGENISMLSRRVMTKAERLG